MSDNVKRISKHSNANRAVLNMIEEMEGMWDGFRCDGEIVADRQWGAWVKVEIPLEDEPEAWTRAYLFRKDEEYVCVVDFYIGENAAFEGTEGNWYTVNDMHELVVM